MKKIISIGVVLTLMLSLLPIGTVSAVTDGETVTKLVNVAKNKPVSTEHSRDESYDPQAIVDDNVSNNNFWYGYIDSTVKPNITIDLQRRYPIEKLRIFDRGNSAMPTRGEFEIWGADREDFSDARLLFELNDNSVFPEKLDYVIELSEKPVCRYVRYQAKNAAVVYLREIQVFSTVTATEISREAATYTTTNLGGGSSMAGDQLVDGDFTDSSALYLKNQGSDENLSGYFSTFTIDLGTNKYVDMIEMYNRRGGGATSGDYRGYFTVYGSNEGTITDFTGLSPDGATAYSKIDKAAFEALTQTDGTTPVYKALSGIPIAVSDYTAQDGSVYNAFPNRASDSDRACYQVTLDNSEAYRYLTYRKNKTAIGSGYNLVQIVEFRAYQINPEIYNITCENGKVILDCSDEMDIDSILNALTITDAVSGENVFADDISLNPDAPWQVLITLPEMFDKKLNLKLTNDAENIKGAALTKIYNEEITLPKAANVETAGFVDENGDAVSSVLGLSEVKAKAEISNVSSEEQTVLMVVCAYNEHHTLYDVKVISQTIAAGAESAPVECTLSLENALGAGDYVTIHLWNGFDAAESWGGMLKMTAE